MKKILLIFIVFILSSCSETILIQNLIDRPTVKYEIKKTEYSYVVKIPCYKLATLDSINEKKQSLRQKLKDNYRGESSDYDPTTSEMNAKILEEFKKDSIKQLYIYFAEPKEKFDVIAIHYWDYSNVRFLVPFLPFFNNEHKKNQCINRALEAAIIESDDIDGVIISDNLFTSRLFKFQK